jgi:hypothetical protein
MRKKRQLRRVTCNIHDNEFEKLMILYWTKNLTITEIIRLGLNLLFETEASIIKNYRNKKQTDKISPESSQSSLS